MMIVNFLTLNPPIPQTLNDDSELLNPKPFYTLDPK